VSNSRPRTRRRPLPPGRTLYTPGASPGRQAFERRSATMLLYLRQLPPWLIPILVAALVFGGLTLRGPAGGILLLVATVFLGWLTAVSWPRLTPAARAGRCAVVAVALAATVIQALR
jgi:hypothetical protein